MRGENGSLCPQIEFRPRTLTGRAVIAALARPGVWLRSGMGGVPSGLDIREALASLPATADLELARQYLMEGESAFLAGVWRRLESDKGKTGNGE